jgi:Uma2 family endonuclease
MATAVEPLVEESLPRRCEVVNGGVIEVPPMGAYASEVANRIRDELAVYGRATGRGRPRMDILYRLPLPSDKTRRRRPDVAFVSFERWPEDRPIPYRKNPLDIVPEVMVEVASPTDKADALFAKALEYLAAGADVSWVVLPRVRQAFVFEPGRTPRAVSEADSLDGGGKFPDLRISMARLFPAVAGE